MREKDIHNLIEQQNPEEKQRMWEKVSSQLDVEPRPKTQVKTKTKALRWASIAVALVLIVTLSITLPLTLRDDGIRYCDATQYTTDRMEQTLQEYSLMNNKDFLCVDWYDIADEVKTNYGYINDNKNDIVFFEEVIVNGETGDSISLSITDNKTRVDKFDQFYEEIDEMFVKDITVKFSEQLWKTLASFEYNGYVYYLQLDVGNAKDQIAEIIEGMLK
ncbi:MAG: hypothetical protein K2M64_02875 [Clostridia bacterium]|nr:hypothetical protein [Clostridia bacterium]